jgi:hypothetical protein
MKSPPWYPPFSEEPRLETKRTFRPPVLFFPVNLASVLLLPRMENRSFSDVGGTPGGLSHFLIGFAMTCIGGYLLSNQVSVVVPTGTSTARTLSASPFCRCYSECAYFFGAGEA